MYEVFLDDYNTDVVLNTQVRSVRPVRPKGYKGTPWGKKQYEVLAGGFYYVTLLYGSIRSGKTRVSIQLCINNMRELAHLGLLTVFIAKDNDTFIQNVLSTLYEIVGEEEVTFRKGNTMFEILGMPCRLITSENIKKFEEKTDGGGISLIYCDEVRHIPYSSFVTSMGRLIFGGSRWIGTTNPSFPAVWFNETIVMEAEKPQTDIFTRKRAIKFVCEDNIILSKKEIDRMKNNYKDDPVSYRRMILGEFVAEEGTVFVLKDYHILKKIPAEAVRYFIGVDPGYSNPFGAVLIGYNPESTPCFWTEDEIYFNGKKNKSTAPTAGDYLEMIKERFGTERLKKTDFMIIDPSAKSFFNEVISSVTNPGRTYDIIKAKNDLHDGIACFKTVMRDKKFGVLHTCENTIREFYSYVWDEKANEKNTDREKVIAQHDHLMDAHRYVFNTLRMLGLLDNLLNPMEITKPKFFGSKNLYKHRTVQDFFPKQRKNYYKSPI